MDIDENIRQTDTTLDELCSWLSTWTDDIERDNNILIPFAEAFVVKLFSMLVYLGAKPSCIGPSFDERNIWLTLANLISEFKEYRVETKTDSSSIKRDVVSNKVGSGSEADNFIVYIVTSTVNPLTTKVQAIENYLLKATQALKKEVEIERSRIDLIQCNYSINPANNIICHALKFDTGAVLETCINGIKGIVYSLKAAADTQAIKTGSLDFRSSKESDAWLEKNHPGDEFEVVLDFHTVMEHVYSSLYSNDIIKNMERVYKLGLATMHQALAITSFEVRLPRFLCKVTGFQVVKGDASPFDNIGNY